MTLFHCQWVISYLVYTTCDTTSTIYQESNGSPTPLKTLVWKLTKTDKAILDLNVTADKLPSIPIRLDDHDDVVKNGQTDDAVAGAVQPKCTTIGLVVGFIVGLFIGITIAVTVFFILKKFNKEEEVPSVDVNPDYKNYQDYDEDNVVVDDNDYYDVETEY